MSASDFVVGFITGIIAGAVVLKIIITNSATSNLLIESQKQFILKNSTYKCTKTNELVND